MKNQPTDESIEFTSPTIAPKVAPGDSPEVTSEVINHVATRMNLLNDELREFLDQRQKAAPVVVTSVRILDLVVSDRTTGWLGRWQQQ